MGGRKAEMVQRKAIENQRDRLLVEIEALRNKVAGLELALSLMGAESTAAEGREKPKESRGLRQTLTDLLREAGTTGLNATSAVEVAQRRGVHLERQSVASTLSRMKKDGELVYNGDRYKLIQFASQVETASADVVQLRA
jgi:hypothetical protein